MEVKGVLPRSISVSDMYICMPIQSIIGVLLIYLEISLLTYFRYLNIEHTNTYFIRSTRLYHILALGAWVHLCTLFEFTFKVFSYHADFLHVNTDEHIFSYSKYFFGIDGMHEKKILLRQIHFWLGGYIRVAKRPA